MERPAQQTSTNMRPCNLFVMNKGAAAVHILGVGLFRESVILQDGRAKAA